MSANAADRGPSTAAGSWSRFACSPWLAVGLAIVCYLNTLGNDFAYDDHPLIVLNPRIESVTDWRAIWLTDWWRPPDDQPAARIPYRDRLYRPLTLFTFALNCAADGRNPLGYHLVNIGLHAVVTGLVWVFALRLSGRRSLAALSAILFAIHPIHVDAVASIVGRAEILAALFLLAGLIVLQPQRRALGVVRVAAASGLFLAALLAKETAICFPALAGILLFERWRHGGLSLPRGLLWLALLLIPLAVYFPLRYEALEHNLIREMVPSGLGNPLAALDPPWRYVGALGAFGRYTWLMFAPAQLSLDYGLAVLSPDAIYDFYLTIGGGGVAALGIALLGYRRPAGSWRLAAVLAAATLASYALISNVLLLIGVAVAERLFYWPSVPVLMLISLGIIEGWHYLSTAPGSSPALRRLGPAAGILLLAAISTRTIVRNPDWSTTLTLFARDVQTHPRGAHLNRGYAVELIWAARQPARAAERRAMLETAERHLRQALEILPTYPLALLNLAQVRAELGDRQRALEILASARVLDPFDRAIQALERQLRDPAATETELAGLRSAVEAQPDDIPARLTLAGRLVDEGHFEEALPHWEHAHRVAPQNPAVLRGLGQTLAGLNRLDEALVILRQAVAADSRDWESHANLAALLSGSAPTESLLHARRAYELAPQDFRVATNFAEALALNGATSEAIRIYARLGRDLPADDPRRAIVEQRRATLAGERR